MAETPAQARRRRLAEIPHKQASEIRITNVPAANGIIAHTLDQVTTACGEEKPTTLVTRRDDLVRCERCKAAMKPLTIEGTDNYGRPRQAFADELAAADDQEYLKIAEERIWLSAYAAHWASG
jgi:hypothetical protein